MAPEPRIGLLDAEPDLGRFLSDDDRRDATRISIPVHTLRGPFDALTVLNEAHAFGALILEGMIMYRLQVFEQPTIRLFGPGDLLSPTVPRAQLAYSSDNRAVGETRIAMLDDHALAAAQRWPRLFAALHLKSVDQAHRLSLQLAICQLPRVTDRLLGLMWLLSETWGRVTTSGVSLPVALTHDTLGGLIGARRPTVTLALGELSDRGAIVKQDLGWLLLEPIAASAGLEFAPDIPTLFDTSPTAWTAGQTEYEALAWTHAELLESVARLRAEHEQNRERMRRRLADLRQTRDRMAQRRSLLVTRSRRQAPSS